MGSEYGENADVGGDLDVKGSSTFNENSADVDFRIESNNNANMFYVNGGTDKIGIGTPQPSGTLHISASATTSTASMWIQGEGDAELRIIADYPDSTSNEANPSIYMSQEAPDEFGYQFHIGIEGVANQSYTGSFTNQPFILSRKNEGIAQSLRTFQIATDDGGDISSRLSIGSGGKVIIGDAVGSADARLHVRDAAGDIFKVENTTAYGVTYGQLVKSDLTILSTGASPVDTTLNLPAAAIVDTVVVKLTTPGAVSSGTNYLLTNVSLDNGAQTLTLFSASLSQFSLIGNGSTVVSGTMYYFNNTQPNYPVGGIGVLNTGGTADIKLDFTDANVTTNAIVDVAVYYRKFDTIR